jgi:hypothetical protein
MISMATAEQVSLPLEERVMRVLTKVFRGTFKSWSRLFSEASEFATEIGPERLISISHSADNSDGVVTVWYWGYPDRCPQCDYNLTGNRSGVCPECGKELFASAGNADA